MPKRVLVVGAGGSGLPAIKCCLDEGLVPVCYDKSDEVGGLWNYTPDHRPGQACVAKSTVINTSKEMMSYSDFPIPGEFANYMHNTKLFQYFKMYADNFGLRKHIVFHTEVLHANKAPDFEKTGKWIVKVKDMTTGEVREEKFDAMMLCTGHYNDLNLPTFPGQEKFKGKILHTQTYKEPTPYKDKRVIIVGIGNSGGDAATEISKVAKQAYMATRRGTWVFNRVSQNGWPLDIFLTRRIYEAIKSYLPENWVSTVYEAYVNMRFDHERYGLKPAHRALQSHVVIQDDLPNRIISGALIVKPNIKSFTETGVYFEDGTYEDNIDAVILATGYKFGVPFVDESVIRVEDNFLDAYKYTFPPNEDSLALIGFVQPWGAVIPIAELQCRWATRVFAGRTKLPPKSEMMKEIEKRRDEMATRYVKTPRHTIQVDWVPFMDDIAVEIGVKPNSAALFFKDYALWKEVFLGPTSTYQYRLEGPGKWEGAREAIMTQWDRIQQPMNTRRVPRDSNDGDSSMTLIFKVIGVLILAWILLSIF